MKKAFALVLCLAMAVSVLAACGGETKETTPPTNESGEAVPVVTIGIPENPNVHYQDNTYTKLIEKLAGVKIEYVFFQGVAADYLQQLSLRVAGQEKLPDIIWGFNGMDEEVRSSYGQDGVFIDITDYLMDEEMSAIWWERFEKASESVQQKTLVEMKDPVTGEIYAFPNVITELSEDCCSFFPMINQKWLDALNLPMPTSIKELEDTLRAFRDGDPNGDGKKNEIPCMVQKNGTGARGLDYLINLYTYLDTSVGWLELDGNGKVVCTATTDKYREALQWVYDMVQEGLIYRNSPNAGSADISAMLCTEGADRLGMIVCHPLIAMGTSSTNKQFVMLETIKYAPIIEPENLYCTFITESCENIEAAWSVLMAMSTEEAMLHGDLGIYGLHYTDADPGAVTAQGTPAKYKQLEPDALPTPNRWLYLACGVTELRPLQAPKLTVEEMTVAEYKRYALEGPIAAYYKKHAAEHNPDRKYICPKLFANADDLQDCPTWTILPDEFKRWRALFMSGEKNPYNETHWAEYLASLESSGLTNYMETAQAIYDRTYKAN